MRRAVANLRPEFVAFCLVVAAATAALVLELLAPVPRAVIWGALLGYCLKAVVEICEGRGPR